jgi:hypothetical protein
MSEHKQQGNYHGDRITESLWSDSEGDVSVLDDESFVQVDAHYIVMTYRRCGA